MGLDKINHYKKKNGITNQQISKITGITISTIDKITSGNNTNPKLETVKAICKVVGCTLNDLVDDDFTKTEKAPVKDRDLRKEKLLKNYDNLNDTGKNVLTAQSDYMMTQPEF